MERKGKTLSLPSQIHVLKLGVSYFSLLKFRVDLMQGDNVDRAFGMYREREGLQKVGQGN
jgi:hypothetical protein